MNFLATYDMEYAICCILYAAYNMRLIVCSIRYGKYRKKILLKILRYGFIWINCIETMRSAKILIKMSDSFELNASKASHKS